MTKANYSAYIVKAMLPVVLLLFSAAACAQDVAPDKPAEATTLASAVDAALDPLERDGMNGVVMVQKGDDVLYARALGFADCARTGPMTLDHVISIGSIAKEMMRVALYDLADDGLLSLDDPVAKWIDPWPADKSAITVRHLLDHRSGLPDIVGESGAPTLYTPAYDFAPTTRAEMIDRARKARLLFDPGTDEDYSNLAYSLLAAIAEEAADAPIEVILQERIFTPAGMTQTGYVLPDWSETAFAEGCYRDGARWGSPYPDGRWLDDGPGWNLRGNGGVYSTARDMTAYMGGLANRLFLSAEADKAWRDDRLAFIKSMGERGMGPAGGNGITNALFFWVEDTDLRIVFMTTRQGHSAEGHAGAVIGAVRKHLAATK